MKKLLPWQIGLLTVWPYAAIALNLFLIRAGLVAWLCGWLGTTLIVSAVNLCCALRQREMHVSARLGMLVKLLHIPAYVLTLLMSATLIVAPPLVLALLATNVIMLLTTSAYTLRAVYLAWRAGILSATWTIALAVSQLLFVLDVPGSIVLYVLEKRRSQ